MRRATLKVTSELLGILLFPAEKQIEQTAKKQNKTLLKHLERMGFKPTQGMSTLHISQLEGGVCPYSWRRTVPF